MSVDKDKAHLTLVFSYTIEDGWTPDPDNAGSFTQSFMPWTIRSELPVVVGADRVAPHSISHPIRTRETLSFKMDETWAMDDDELIIDNAAFRYAKVSRFYGGYYSDVYTLVSKQDAVMPEHLPDVMAAVETSRRHSWLGLAKRPAFQIKIPVKKERPPASRMPELDWLRNQ